MLPGAVILTRILCRQTFKFRKTLALLFQGLILSRPKVRGSSIVAHQHSRSVKELLAVSNEDLIQSGSNNKGIIIVLNDRESRTWMVAWFQD